MKFSVLITLLVLSVAQDAESSDFLRTLRNIFFGSNSNNAVVAASNADCAIDIRTELNRTASGTVKEPLFLKYVNGGYKLMVPDDNGDLKFKGGESALVACTSDQKPNTLTLSKYKERRVHVCVTSQR